MLYSITKECYLKNGVVQIIKQKRERDSSTDNLPFRNEFDKDYERIITSSSLRRLQDKAQVFPLQENDFTRTRLTHSLEVSSIARSIGKRIGHHLVKEKLMEKSEAEELTSLLAVCGLVHDIGNPPFGHYGEDIIKDWFEKNRDKYKNIENILTDFCCFDGNAQTIRILSKLQYLQDSYGLNLCYGTLATLLKSTNSSYEAIKEDKVSKRKIGYFESERSLFEKIVKETGMKDEKSGKVSRHQATYLLEAADDIAYIFADLEDAVKKDYAIWEDIKQKVLEVTNKSKAFKFINTKIEDIKKVNENRLSTKDRVALEAYYLKVLCQGKCIELICDEFRNSYNKIMSGEYENSLCDSVAVADLIGDKGIARKMCSKYAYSNSEVLSLELIGKKVLVSLLERFINAALDEKRNDKKTESGKLYSKISPNFIIMQNFNELGEYENREKLKPYEYIQIVIDYISGMTDSYALNLHKILEGMKLP